MANLIESDFGFGFDAVVNVEAIFHAVKFIAKITVLAYFDLLQC